MTDTSERRGSSRSSWRWASDSSLFPVALLVLTLPGWSERQVTARVIAREVARRIAREGVCDVGAARTLGATMAHNLGVPADGLEVDVDCAPGRGA